MSSLYIRFAGPLQSWAGFRVTGNVVTTQDYPSHRALVGMVAAAMGQYRGSWSDWLWDLQFVIRIDKRGMRTNEYQTINPRDEDLRFQQRMHAITTGKRFTNASNFTPDSRNLTSIVRRTYLANAEFFIEIVLPEDSDRAKELVYALSHPKFVLYLGRKAFAPTFPFILGVAESGMLGWRSVNVGVVSDKKVLPCYKEATRSHYALFIDKEDSVETTASSLVVMTKQGKQVTVSEDIPVIRSQEEWLRAIRSQVKVPEEFLIEA